MAGVVESDLSSELADGLEDPAPEPTGQTDGMAPQPVGFNPAIVKGRSRTLVWTVVAVITGLSGLSYSWGMTKDLLEPFYQAAVGSMALNWHNFFYGAFDPAGTVTIDKLPGAFWLQALSVRAFGNHTWTMVLPQVVAGMLTVVFLFKAVERLMGTAAGIAAAVILAASPATVALNRGNIADTTMTLFLVLAADAVSAAIMSGRQRHLVLAGLWIGFAFQAKMLEAWLVLPAFALAYLFARTDRWSHKLRQVAIGGLVAVVVSLSWMTMVTLTPAANRPYVDGSQNNSVYEQVFVYNGFGRTNPQSGFQQFTAGLHLPSEILDGPSPAWNRLVQDGYGRDAGWLLPAALIVGVGGLFTRRRSYFILWAGWLITMVPVFSDIIIFHSYYLGALAPPMAAIIGAGVVGLWESRTEVRSVVARHRAAAAVVVAGTVVYSVWLIRSSGAVAPNWLWPLAISIGGVAVALLVISAVWSNRKLLTVALIAGAAAVLVIPATGSALVVSQQRGAFDTPFESAKTAAQWNALLGSSKAIGSFLPQLEKLQMGSPYVMAVYTSAVASEFIDVSGKEILPIGGFTGSIPEPTVSQLKSYIRQGKFHVVLVLGKSRDPRMLWITSHCQSHSIVYVCTPGDVPVP